MIRTFAVAGILTASTLSLSTTAFAETPLPGVDLANQIINDVTAPLQPILTADATPAPAPAAATPRKAKHHARAHKAKHHVASQKAKHKAKAG